MHRRNLRLWDMVWISVRTAMQAVGLASVIHRRNVGRSWPSITVLIRMMCWSPAVVASWCVRIWIMWISRRSARRNRSGILGIPIIRILHFCRRRCVIRPHCMDRVWHLSVWSRGIRRSRIPLMCWPERSWCRMAMRNGKKSRLRMKSIRWFLIMWQSRECCIACVQTAQSYFQKMLVSAMQKSEKSTWRAVWSVDVSTFWPTLWGQSMIKWQSLWISTRKTVSSGLWRPVIWTSWVSAGHCGS